jgi:hypothetical protein
MATPILNFAVDDFAFESIRAKTDQVDGPAPKVEVIRQFSL